MKSHKNRPGTHRLLAIALVLAMLLTIMPAAALADPEPVSTESSALESAAAPEVPAEEPEAPVEAPEEEPAAEEPAAEEPAVEEPAAEEPAPAIVEELKVDDLTVSIDAEAGAFPEGAVVSAEKVDLKDVQKAVDDAEGVSGKVLYAVDITFTLDGEELQPAEGKTVKVSFSAEDLKAVADDAAVVHIDSETNEAEKVATVEAEDADVAFEAEEFSVYAVIGEHTDDPRLHIIFKQDSTQIADMYLKSRDVANNQTNMVVYDPGIPQQEGMLFTGWTTEQNYTAETVGKTIEEIRNDAEDTVTASGFTQDAEIVYYAMMFKVAYLYYEDQDHIVFQSEPGLYTGEDVTMTVSADYTPAADNQGLIGWVVEGTTTPCYKKGDQITISADTVLEPLIGEGYWIYFDENDGGAGVGNASYTPPVFVPGAQKATDYQPSDPTRPGYTFDGWYTSAGGDTPFDFDRYLTSNETAYAHWSAKENASYKIVIWTQKVTDDKNASDAEKEYDYFEVHEVTDVASDSQITAATLAPYTSYGNADFGVTDLDHGSTAFVYRTYEIKNGTGANKDCVSADDSTVVNIYYDRAMFYIRFTGVQGGTTQVIYTYTEEDANGLYGIVDGEYVPLTMTASRSVVWSKRGNTNPDSSYYFYAPNNYLGELTNFYSNGSSRAVSSLILTNAVEGTVYSNYRDNRLTTSGSDYMMYTEKNGTRIYAQVKINSASYSYQGQPYTGPRYQRTTGSAVVYSGLYGQDFAMYGYQWFTPSNNSYWHGIAYLDSFNSNFYGGSTFGGNPNMITLEPKRANDPDVNITVYYWTQDADNLGSYSLSGSARYGLDNEYNITDRVQGTSVYGYKWSNSTSFPGAADSNWDTALNGTHTAVHRNGEAYLHIRYDRQLNDIIFMCGDNEVKRVEDVPFGRDLDGYESAAPTAEEVAQYVPDGYYFVGWYEDPLGNNAADWTDTMPLGNKTFYAKVLPLEYHVIIDLNGGQLPAGTTQQTEFWVPYQTVLDDTELLKATKTVNGKSYSLVGYFTDEDGTQPWNFSTKLTNAAMAIMYDGPDDPLRNNYGDWGDYDEDGQNDFASTVGVFTLYAKWRDDTIAESGGITIRYEYTDKDGVTQSFEDPLHYADQALVVAAAAPPAADLPADKQFDTWQLGNHTYYPTRTFYADSALAVEEQEDGTTKLVITLTATLVSKGVEKPTHIDWYSNIQSIEGDSLTQTSFTKPSDAVWTEDYGWVISDKNLQINEDVAIPAFDTYAYPGYNFVGWGKASSTSATSFTLNNTIWLKWVPANGNTAAHYEAEDNEGNWVEVEYVAADEIEPYDNLFALWQKRPTFTVKYYYNTASREVIDHSETIYCDEYPNGYNIIDGAGDHAGMDHSLYLYGGYQIESEDPTNAENVIRTYCRESGDAMTPVAGKTYDVKMVPISDNYLKPFMQYIQKGKDPKYATDVWLFSSIDDQWYKETGFIIKDDQNSPYAAAVKSKVTIKNSKDKVVSTVTRQSAFVGSSATINPAGYVTYILLPKTNGDYPYPSNTTFEITPYWVTYDNVTVEGPYKKVIGFGNQGVMTSNTNVLISGT